MSAWTFTLPFPTPSLNEIQGHHWAWAREQKSVIRWALASALNRIKPISKAEGKRKVVISRHGKGILDRDNLVGGCKWLIDAIRERGLILDDCDASLYLVVEQVVNRKITPYTEVTIEEITT